MRDNNSSKGKQEDNIRERDRGARSKEHTVKLTVGTKRKSRTEECYKRTNREYAEEREMERTKK